MFRFNPLSSIVRTSALLILIGSSATAQSFQWNARTAVNGTRASGRTNSAWNRTSSGRQSLSHPASAQGRKRLSQPTSSQGRLRLATPPDATGRVRLQSSSSHNRSARQQHVERYIQEQIRRDQAERLRRQQRVERLFNYPAETIVMPLSSGKPQPVTVMPLGSARPQPTTLLQFEEVMSQGANNDADEDAKERDDD